VVAPCSPTPLLEGPILSKELDVDGISSVKLDPAYMSTVQSMPQPQHGRRHPGMEAAANLLGVSESDLRTALQGGQSLSQIAASKGISEDQLVSTISSAIQQANPDISADQANRVATSIATRTPGTRDAGGAAVAAADGAAGSAAAGGHRHHGHHGMKMAMQATASTLGVSSDELASALKSGQSLSDVAQSKGIGQDDLVSAIATALEQSDGNLSPDQATQIATRLATASPGVQPWFTENEGATSTFGITA
jgi:uncharacterized protein YidB (DUF937 family)